MKNFGAKWLALATVVAVGASMSLNGCGDGPSPSPIGGTTGGAGRGGTTGSAGTGGSTTGRGGTGGSTAGTGGGSAGRGGTGGSTAGTTGTAGTGGTSGGLPCPGFGTFDSDTQGFGFNGYMGTAANSTVNLAVREAGTQATIARNATEGDPAAGSLKVDAPFDDYNQMVDIQKTYGGTNLQSWTGYKVHVRVKVMGGNPSTMNPMGVQPYVNTGMNYEGYCGKYTNLIAGNGWNDYVLDLSTCTAPADASKVIAVGVAIQSGSGTDNDGGVNSMKPMMATIYIDSFWLEGSCGGTGGAGGGTAGAAGGTGGAAGGATGTGGAAGGATGTGGAAGGATGTGGAAGGATGTGGAAGGATGTGGAAGGSTGTAGAAGGTAGAGGAALTTLYDFEAGVQGWATTTAGAAVAAAADQHFDGAQSLKITYGVLDGINVATTVTPVPALWPGTVLTFHAYLPAGLDTSGGTYFQTFTQVNNYKTFDTSGNGTRTPTAGAWNTWTYTVPNTFPGGLNVLGFQLGDNASGTTIPAGSVYLDAITATGGTQNCAVAVGTGAHTFETALDANVYKKDGSDADTVATQSTDRANGGTGSWKVAFTALPAPTTAGTMTSRRVFIDSPNIYCGQVATMHVYLPAASDGLTFQAFTQYNNYGGFHSAGPATVARAGWNTYAYTLPNSASTTPVGPGGIQRLGVQLIWAGTTAFTGNVYIDDVTW